MIWLEVEKISGLNWSLAKVPVFFFFFFFFFLTAIKKREILQVAQSRLKYGHRRCCVTFKMKGFVSGLPNDRVLLNILKMLFRLSTVFSVFSGLILISYFFP